MNTMEYNKTFNQLLEIKAKLSYGASFPHALFDKFKKLSETLIKQSSGEQLQELYYECGVFYQENYEICNTTSGKKSTIKKSIEMFQKSLELPANDDFKAEVLRRIGEMYNYLSFIEFNNSFEEVEEKQVLYFDYLRKSYEIKQTSSETNHLIGMCLYKGIGVEQDIQEANNWFKRNWEENGNERSWAMSYLIEHGVEDIDFAEALYLSVSR